MADLHAQDPPLRPRVGDAAYWQRVRRRRSTPERSVLDGILQVQATTRTARSASAAPAAPPSAAPAACGSTARPRSPATRASATPPRRPSARRPDRRRADGQHAVIKDLIVDMDAVHWKKVQRVVPWLLPEGDAAGARVHRPGRGDDRRHAVDGLHPVRRLRRRLPVARGRPRVHRPGRAREGLPLRRRPARRRRPRSACATSPRTRTASTTAPTASPASRSARRTSRR